MNRKLWLDGQATTTTTTDEDTTTVRITSPRLVANGVGAWSGTVEEYDADVLPYDNRFYRTVLEKVIDGIFGKGLPTATEGEGRLPTTLSEVYHALSREEFAEFCIDLFDDPNISLD